MDFFKAIGVFINECGLSHMMIESNIIASGSVNGLVEEPTLLENQNTKQDDDYDDIDNNGSSDNDDDYEDASVFCDTFTE
ncbi:hypothetical protein TNCV_2772701 [Trichonephila clavipes]|nr:hypothetical protein TNCV_2772701 [Trichonephila clavipes]